MGFLWGSHELPIRIPRNHMNPTNSPTVPKPPKISRQRGYHSPRSYIHIRTTYNNVHNFPFPFPFPFPKNPTTAAPNAPAMCMQSSTYLFRRVYIYIIVILVIPRTTQERKKEALLTLQSMSKHYDPSAPSRTWTQAPSAAVAVRGYNG